MSFKYIQVKIVNTYVCIKATPISKKINTNKIPIGKIFATKKKSPINIIDQLNPTITFNKVCPAIIFANNRTDKLNNRKVYEINSIGTNKNIIAKGVPCGKNKLNK
jgi:hypothetical protein